MPSFPTPTCPSVQSVARLDCLSWVCPKIAPPSSCRYRSPLPAAPRGTAFGTGLPTPVRVPSSWFLTTSTSSSSDTVPVYCNELPTLGFTPFRNRHRRLPRCAASSSGCCPCPPKPSLRPKLQSPAPLLHANVDSMRRSRGSTSPACCHAVHRDPCPLTLSLPSPGPSPRLPARACQDRFGRASRPSSANGPVATPAVSRRLRPVLPWA